jgi:hypothetical protein
MTKQCLIWFLLLVGSPIFGNGIELSLLKTEPLESNPGTALSLPIQISNLLGPDFTGVLHTSLPATWQPLSIDPLVGLPTQQKEMRIVSFFVPRNYPAGSYTISVWLLPTVPGFDTVSLNVAIRINRVTALKIEPYQAPEFVKAGEKITSKFLVKNLSNTSTEIKLEAYPGQIDGKSSIELPVGESKLVTVVSTTNSEITLTGRASIQLRASLKGDSLSLQQSAYQHVTVIPVRLPADVDGRSIPGHVKLTYLTRTDPRGNMASGLQGEVFSHSFLDESREHELEVLLRGPNRFNISTLANYDEYYAWYKSPRLYAFAGDKNYALTPLTEFARFGRGAEIAYSARGVTAGAFYQQPRFTREIRSELGTYVKYQWNQNLGVGLHFLDKLTDADSPSQKIFSLSANAQLPGQTSLYGEISRGSMDGDRRGNAFYGSITTKPMHRLELNALYLNAGKHYPGYFTNSEQYSGYLNFWLVKQRLSFNFSAFQDARNASLDTLFGVAPLSRRLQAGFNFRLSSKSSVLAFARKGESEDRRLPKLFHYEDRSLWLQLNQQIGGLNFTLAGEFGETNNLIAPASEGKADSYRLLLESSYQWQNRHQVRGFLNYFKNNRYSVEAEGSWQVGASLMSLLTKTTQLRLLFQNIYTLEDYFRDRSLFEVGLTQRIRHRHELSLIGRYALLQKTVNSTNLEVALSYVYHFSIPLSGKDGYGKVIGRISNEGVPSVGGIALLLDGQWTVTDAAGNFTFKRVKPGEHILLLDRSSLSIHALPDIPVPLKLVVTADAVSSLAFGLTEGASIIGTIRVGSEEGTSENGSPEPPPNQYVMVEAVRDGEVLRKLTDAQGEFAFLDIMPGEWKIRILENSLPARVTLDQKEFSLTLGPGGKGAVNFQLTRKKKNIRFLNDSIHLIERN